MTYILETLTPYQEESFLRWAQEAAVEVKSKPAPRKRKDKKAVVLDSDDAPTKEEFMNEIREGLKEMKLHEQGKIQLPTLKEFINELQCSDAILV
jgi:CHASE3 domain sensor protein